MKNVKGFRVGDKVFAKVKGYPAWPAIVTEAHNTKYNVKFYGTGETGIVKPKDIFYYLKHKNTITKALKRKDYNDAIEEIESAIEECGTDGNNEADTSFDSTTLAPNNSVSSINSKRKRKRSSSVSSDKLNEVEVPKKNAQSTAPADNTEDSEIKEEDAEPQINQKDKADNGSKTNAVDSPEAKRQKTTDDNNEDLQDTESRTSKADEIKNEIANVPGDFKIVPDEYLENLIAYAEHVRKNEAIYTKKPIEKITDLKNEIIVAKLPEGKYIGIKYNREDPPPMKNEFQYAEYYESEAKTILALKKVVEKGTCKIEDDPDLFETNLNIDDAQLFEIIQLDLISRKKLKLTWLRIESSLIELDAKIKASLGLDKADPEAALDHLHSMLKLDVDPLMLKKHPHVVDMIKRLRRYIGNVTEWKMTDDERKQFEKSAQKVKDVALDIYMKFANLFNIDDPTMFWDHFTKELQQFKIQVKDMQQSSIYALSAEPYSRQAFFEELDAKEELKLLETEFENTDKENRAEKENSSRIANTDESEGSDNVIDTSNSNSPEL